MVSEEHLKNDDIWFRNVNGHREPVHLRIRRMLIAYCVCDFLFYGYAYMRKENVMFYRRKKSRIRHTDKGHINLSNLQV